MVDEEGLGLDGGVWDEIMAGYLAGGDLQRGKWGEVERCHRGRNGE
jgi:hypothetical protein